MSDAPPREAETLPAQYLRMRHPAAVEAGGKMVQWHAMVDEDKHYSFVMAL
jgi:hypothetical protein